MDEIFSHYIDDKLAGAPDVLSRIFWGASAGRAVSHAYSDNWRVDAQVVVCAEGSGVQPALFVHARHPGDWPRGYQADQQIVGLPRSRVFHVDLHCLPPM